MATGVGWDCVRTGCSSTVQQTCTWSHSCCDLVQPKVKGEHHSGQCSNWEQIFTILLQKFTTGSQKQFSFTALLINLFSRSEPYKILQTKAPTVALRKECWVGARKTWLECWFSRSLFSELERVSICTSRPHLWNVTPALLLSQDPGEG